ncbi:MAG: hypothetical protein ACYTG5_00815 [Planctomycetota bacterium]|jgi:hypothetical protein
MNIPKTVLLSLALLSPLTILAPAQAQARLVGLSDGNTQVGTNNAEILHIDTGTCTLGPRCSLGDIMVAPTKFAGGTAYDPENRAIWVSNGKLLARVSVEGCRVQCGPFAAPMGPILPNTVVTGLAYRKSSRQLYMVDSARRLTILQVDDCNLSLVERCTLNLNLPNNFFVSGLAVDELTGRILYSASDFTEPSISPSEPVFIAEESAPCDPVWTVRLSDCSGLGILGPVTGLAYDPCANIIHATNGREIVSAQLIFTPDGGCTLGAITCCLPAPGAPRLVGLDLIPERDISSLGHSCTNGVCPSCAVMTHSIASDPVIGNQGLRFRLNRAPDDSIAFLVINEGGCNLPGLPVPPICGPFLVDLLKTPPLLRGGFLTGNIGKNECDGSVDVPLPVPLNPSLCGQEFGSQFLVICLRGLTIGTGLSNCQEWVISGS